jgi:hypothetical protein
VGQQPALRDVAAWGGTRRIDIRNFGRLSMTTYLPEIHALLMGRNLVHLEPV